MPFGLIMSAVILALMLFKAFRGKDDKWQSLLAMLDSEETYVDGTIAAGRAYMIVSRQGRTDYGDLIVIFEQGSGQEWKRTYENDFTGLKPWKIATADIDGDNKEEILTAVKKSTHFDKIEDNRMFIFNYTDNILVKKWTGSRIAGRWKDFYAGDLLPISGDELIFVEREADGDEHLSVYYWFDFGFFLLAESKDYKNISDVSIIGSNVLKIKYDYGKTSELTVKDGKIKEIKGEDLQSTAVGS